MTNKQRILQMVEGWAEDISYDQALYHLSVLRAIDAGLKDIEAGRVREFDEVFDDLERRCDKEAGQAASVETSRKRSRSASKKDRGTGRAKNGEIVRKPAKKVRKQVT